ncbi:HepT-like ribonuclease domain-containing protein [Methanolobus psychrotolerans]|uniref:HepT-like ribonuclease domain-containing protein n=1 Tax=Methanolobus psychrotolerans TaxID=1874706 RepID=UPI000B919C0A|nr:DUF86 domain-containing protein [Methanolobus psychrotolerans]
MPRDQLVFFADMLAAIEKIQRYVENITFEEFLEDEMRVDAVVRNLEIIGEAAGKIPPETRYKYSHIPWKRIVGLRNILIHEYFGIDMDIVWDIIENYLPDLEVETQRILKDKKSS